MPQFMPQFPSQGQPSPPAQPSWQGQPSQPPQPPQSQSTGQWQQPTTGYQSAPQYPGQWQQPVQQGMFPPPQQQTPTQSGIYPPPQQQQQPMQSGMFPPPQQQQQKPMQQGMFPPPQKQTPQKNSQRGLWIVLGVIVVLLLVFGGIVAFMANSANSANTVAPTQVATVGATQVSPTAIVQSQPTIVSGKQHFKVGQVVKVNATWLVTITSVKTMDGNTFSTPTAGNTYFIVDVTLTNLSKQEQNVSSALNFSLVDASGQKYTETILIGETPPDGKVGANSLMHGQLTYEVPTMQNAFTFNFEPDLIAGALTVWDLQK